MRPSPVVFDGAAVYDGRRNSPAPYCNVAGCVTSWNFSFSSEWVNGAALAWNVREHERGLHTEAIMTTQEHFLRFTRRTINEFGTGHRIAGLIVLVVVAMLGTMQWMHLGSSAAAPDSAQQQAPADNAPVSVPYFPAQYVNQATQAEKHIESF